MGKSIALREGEFVVAAYKDQGTSQHFAMTNLGILWRFDGANWYTVY